MNCNIHSEYFIFMQPIYANTKFVYGIGLRSLEYVADVLNRIQSMLQYRTLTDCSSPMTIFKPSECFISAQFSYANLKHVYYIGSCLTYLNRDVRLMSAPKTF